MSESSSREAFTDLVNAIQIARPLIRALRKELTDQARTAVQAEEALNRALRALQQIEKRSVRS